jgi:hypothetical protein
MALVGRPAMSARWQQLGHARGGGGMGWGGRQPSGGPVVGVEWGGEGLEEQVDVRGGARSASIVAGW